ncbi:MAG: hypothetical protein ABWZ80_05975 [Beijerinckiaceae bacterium]
MAKVRLPRQFRYQAEVGIAGVAALALRGRPALRLAFFLPAFFLAFFFADFFFAVFFVFLTAVFLVFFAFLAFFAFFAFFAAFAMDGALPRLAQGIHTT